MVKMLVRANDEAPPVVQVYVAKETVDQTAFAFVHQQPMGTLEICAQGTEITEEERWVAASPIEAMTKSQPN